MKSNVTYSFSENGKVGYGKLQDGTVFIFDADMINKIDGVNFYRSKNNAPNEKTYIIDCRGKKLHDYLFKHISGLEIDHINLSTLDNRRCNIRYATHQQNQMNQPLQKNNTSGVSGVSYYPPRGKFRARIKVYGKEIHLGYYDTFVYAVMARNVGMKCMFGQYGRYVNVGTIPKWIENKVYEKCVRFETLARNSAFFDFREVDANEQ